MKFLITSLKVAFFAFFSGCFVIQGRDAWDKFIGKDTTVVTKSVLDPNLRFPALTICPNKGFREDKMEELGKYFLSFC